MSRIDTFDIKCRIGFCESELLGFLQHNLEGSLLIRHFAQYIVGCTVDNAENRFDTIRCQAFLQGLNDRDCTAYTGFEADVDLFCLSSPEYFVSVGS